MRRAPLALVLMLAVAAPAGAIDWPWKKPPRKKPPVVTDPDPRPRDLEPPTQNPPGPGGRPPVVVPPGSRPPPKHLQKKYLDEDDFARWVADDANLRRDAARKIPAPTPVGVLDVPEPPRVDYLDVKQRDPYRVGFRDGKLVRPKKRSDGTWELEPLDTSASKIRDDLGGGKGLYVVDTQGNFYVAMHEKPGRFHHSTLVGGEPVLAAGEIVVRNGKVVEISNASGHYKPHVNNLRWMVDELGRAGALAPRFMAIDVTRRPGFEPVKLRAKYAGEDDYARWVEKDPRFAGDPDVATREVPTPGGRARVPQPPQVRYLDGVERERFRVLVDDQGRLYRLANEEGRLRKKLLNQDDAIYVMDMHGNLYVGEKRLGEIHHSSFFAGEPVAGAGYMTVRKGRVVEIDNSSGHYRPSEKHLDQVVGHLRKQKVEVDKVEVYDQPR